MKRLCGIDLGNKRIGVAISDELGLLAHPHTTITNDSLDYAVAEVVKTCHEEAIEAVVVGFPLTLGGKESEQVKKVQKFVDKLKEAVTVPVYLQDERLSTQQAERELREAGIKGSRVKEMVDAQAAKIILQNWLDSQK